MNCVATAPWGAAVIAVWASNGSSGAGAVSQIRVGAPGLGQLLKFVNDNNMDIHWHVVVWLTTQTSALRHLVDEFGPHLLKEAVPICP